MSPDHIPSWCVFADHVPALCALAAIGTPRNQFPFLTSLLVSSDLVIVRVSAVHGGASKLHRRLPYELCEMARFLCKASRFAEVVHIPLIAPCGDSSRGIGIPEGEVFTIRTILNGMLVDISTSRVKKWNKLHTECFQRQVSAHCREYSTRVSFQINGLASWDARYSLLTSKTVSLKSSSEVYEAGLGMVGVARMVVAAWTVVVTTTMSWAIVPGIRLGITRRMHHINKRQ